VSEGFAAVPNWLIRDTTVSIYAISVYAALASHAGKGGIFPSQETLATEGRCSVRKVRDALGELEQLGVVARVRRSSRGGRSSDGYVLQPNGIVDDQQPAQDAGSGEQPARGAAATGTSEQLVPLIEEEPIKNASEFFDEFWAVYPRHVAKAAAKAKFEQLGKKRGVDLAAIVEGARRYAASGDLPEPKFIPHPMTWLNQGRWEDEVPAPAPATLADAIRPSQDDWLAARGITLEEYTAHYREPGWLEQLERDYMRRLDE
jgi:hypothetical protein